MAEQGQGRARGRGRARAPAGAAGPAGPAQPAGRSAFIAPGRSVAASGRGQLVQGAAPRPPNARGPAFPPASGPALPSAATEPGDRIAVGENTRGAMRGKRVISHDIIHTRPKECVSKKGVTGRELVLEANYYRLLKKPSWSVYQYRVDFAPDVDSTRARRALLSQHKALFQGFIFDGTVLFTAQNINNCPMELVSKFPDGDPIKITVKFVGVTEVTDAQFLQVLNLILRRSMEGLKLQQVGRDFFDALAKVALNEHKIELWPGYLTSIRQNEKDILLCAEITHKVMRTETIYHILKTCIQESRNYQDVFKREVIGMVVLTDYNNKTYRIDDVDFNSSPASTFPTKDGPVAYTEYYKRRYNIIIKDKDQPLLVSRSKERDLRAGQSEFIMLIPELSRATGLTENMRNNFRLMRDMSDHTRLAPSTRIDRLIKYNQRLAATKESKDVLEAWQLQLDKNLVQLPGRLLNTEYILFGNNQKVLAGDEADWTREFRNKSMFKSAQLKRWYVVTPNRGEREAFEFVKNIRKVADGMRMLIAEPRILKIADDRIGSYVAALEKCCQDDPQLIMVVVPNNNAERYSCIKKKCCVDRAVASQVIVQKTITPRPGKPSGLMSVATKVVIQMNAKLQGIPWMIELPLSGLMTVGFDVCHSARDRTKSFGALVATMDMKTSQSFFSCVTQHMKGQELSNEIALNMTKALAQYRDIHGALPARILFYRDGVGDGQLHQVVETEVKHLRERLDAIYQAAGGQCKMAFIIVSKRIQTRYFHNKQNPRPGTVVDDVITLPERYDFFLVSQSVRQGTVSPTSYNVISDNMGLNADKLQILSYKMCHLYFNWSGTTRVPAVVQYAHKLAFLVSQSIHQNPSNALERNLYYL